MSALSAFKQAYLDKERKSFDKIYVLIDLHGTIIKPNYTYGKIPTEFYPNALETLKLMTICEDITLIMYTCSHPHEINEYVELFKKNGIKFEYVNENPEVVTQANGYGCYDKKPYMNVLLDDKAGFDPSEWDEVLDFLKQRYGLNSEIK